MSDQTYKCGCKASAGAPNYCPIHESHTGRSLFASVEPGDSGISVAHIISSLRHLCGFVNQTRRSKVSKSIYKIAVVAYILVAILTFGHAFNNLKAPQELTLYGSAGCAVAWPLYWSAQLFAKE